MTSADPGEPSSFSETFPIGELADLTTGVGGTDPAFALAAITSLRRMNLLRNFPDVEGAGSSFPDRVLAKYPPAQISFTLVNIRKTLSNSISGEYATRGLSWLVLRSSRRIVAQTSVVT